MKKEVAYLVEERGGDNAVIVFARCNAAARRAGSAEISDGDFHSVAATRLQWADAYVEAGDVPPIVMIEHGWWFNCTGCERRVCDDANDYLEEGNAEVVPFVRRGDVFCSKACCAEFVHERRIKKKIEAEVSKWWVDSLLEKYPGVELADQKIHVYAAKHESGWHIRSVSVAFRFPGSANGDAHYSLADDYAKRELTVQLTVPAGDLLAWRTWRGDDLDKVEWPKWFPRPVLAS